MTTQSRSLRFADQLATHPYAWPGGYPLYAIMDDGEPLCKYCAAAERAQIGTTTGSDGWCIRDLDINYERRDLFCAHCSIQIEAAYA